MNRRVAGVLAAGLAASGCKSLDERKPKDRAEPAARTQPAGRSWLDGPGPKLADVGVPKADSWGDARDPGYDQTRDVQGVLSGWVEDPDGRKAREVFIEVEPADGGGGGAPVGTQTDKDGYFLLKGLKPNTAFQLTVRAKLDGKEAAGRVYARTGSPTSQRVRLPLVENMTLPATPVSGTSSGGPAADDRPPREPQTSRDTRPEPRPATDPPPGEPPTRPELTTQGQPGIARPPVTNIPPLVAQPPTREVRAPAKRFTLVSPAGEPREFPGPGLTLLLFTAADTPPVPPARDLQARYGLRGLEVVGVVGDDPAAADKYQREAGLNYLVYVDGGDRPGELKRRFRVTAEPAFVLLEAGGAVVWQGTPDATAELERAVRERVR